MSDQGFEGDSKLHKIIKNNLAAAEATDNEVLKAEHRAEATRAALKINKQGTHARAPEREKAME